MEKQQRDDVAVFVDFENVYVSVREKFDATPNFELIMDRCEDYGRITIARAYADWYRYPRVTSALFANGVEPMYVPTYYYDRDAGRTGRPIKNSVDIHLCIDVMRTLYTQPHILKYVLVTGDRDFIPLVNAIRQQGKEVIIIGIGGAASAHLAQSGDEFLFYEQIADLKAPGQTQAQNRLLAAQEQVAQPQEGRNGDRDDRREREERAEREGRDASGARDSRDTRSRRPERERRPRVETAEESALPLEGEAAPVVETSSVMADTSSVAASTPGPVQSPYDTLVSAIQLARQRGFVANLGSLKVVMRELDSAFHESKVKDSNGKPFIKFKDFVKEAENQGKVQIFTNGTVTEVFLPGEDPYRLSQFAEDLTSNQVEREIISELAAEGSPAVQETVEQQLEVPAQLSEAEFPATAPIESVATPQAAVEAVAEAEDTAESTDGTRRTFADREWEVFRASMAQFADPVRFAEIFNALRGLRNQEVFELTNNELKELVKQAINRGMLQRTGRGAKAYYRLSGQYRTPQAVTPEPLTSEDVAPTEAQLQDQRTPAATRRTRVYLRQQAEAQAAADAAEQTSAQAEASTAEDGTQTALPGLEEVVAGAEAVGAEADTDVATSATEEGEAEATTGAESPAAVADTSVPTATGEAAEASPDVVQRAASDVEAPTKQPSRRRNQRQQNTTPAPVATTQPVDEAPKASGNRRRKTTAAPTQAEPTPPPGTSGETNGAPKRRRRRKADTNGDQS